MEKKLNNIYYTAKHGASYGGVEKLYHATEKKYHRKEIEKWLAKQDTYTKHRKAFKRYPTRKVISYGIKNLFQADLADMSNIAEFNDDTNFILLVIDVFSKMVYATPVKRKNGPLTKQGLEKVFEQSGIPDNLQTDDGNEFVNATVQKFLKEKGVNFYTTKSEKKVCSS